MKTIIIAASLVAASGCAASSSSAKFSQSVPMPIDMSTRTTQDVEVLIDEKPVRPHHDVGVLRAMGRDEATCLHAMQRTAASAGIDGFYSISCGSDGTQQCTARAFVYEE